MGNVNSSSNGCTNSNNNGHGKKKSAFSAPVPDTTSASEYEDYQMGDSLQSSFVNDNSCLDSCDEEHHNLDLFNNSSTHGTNDSIATPKSSVHSNLVQCHTQRDPMK
jgi:hypothetical protein